MVEEHRNIRRMLSVVRKYCSRILNGETVNYEDFFGIIEFIRGYADKHHHGKEETLLFARMTEELGPAANKLVRYGMNVEHDMGRLFVQDLEIAVRRVLDGDLDARLDVIANAISYTHLLERHIEKEDSVVYKFAQRDLAIETKERLERECFDFERAARAENIQTKYLALLEEFENRD
jgi:hemerythrin-like domain-containing protein